MQTFRKGFILPLISLLIVSLLALAGVCYWKFALQPKPAKITHTNTSINTTADETADWKPYENSQADFSLNYPPAWSISQKPKTNAYEDDGIILKGKEGLIEIGWTTQFGGGGCEQNYSISLSDQTIKSCRAINSDGTETWSLFGWEGSSLFPIVYGDVTVNAPYRNNEAIILKIFSTVKTKQ